MNQICPCELGRAICTTFMRFNNLREIKPNANWDNPSTPGPDSALVKEFIAMLKSTGWVEGWAYCAATVDAVVCKAIRECGGGDVAVARFTRLMQLGVLNSYRAFRDKGMTVSKAPNEPGTIWLAQHGQTSQGHTGVLLAASRQMISTIEANTSKDAVPGDRDREGDWITTKLFSEKGRGTLRTLGFVTPTAICELIN